MAGMETARCRVCNRKLSSPEAVAAGMGPVCFRKVTGHALSHSAGRSKKGPDKEIMPRRTARRRVLVNQISIFDTREEDHGTDTQKAG